MAALARAARHWDRQIVDQLTVGWHGRTAGVAVQDYRGTREWLRVVVAQTELARGDWWNGNTDAVALAGVRRPTILAWHEWSEGAVRTRAELMELLPGHVCSTTPELRRELNLDSRWWSTLKQSLDLLAGHRTSRESTTTQSISHRSHVLFGRRVEFTGVGWSTAHGDLHWANLFAPEFALLDWEAWGRAPDGSDIAGLYLHSLLVPEVAATILARFPDVFASTSGRVGLVFHASRMLARAMAGDYPDLIDPIHQAVRRFAPPA
jgi:hypothetical protein